MGLSSLRIDRKLVTIAKAHSDHMMLHDAVSHDNQMSRRDKVGDRYYFGESVLYIDDVQIDGKNVADTDLVDPATIAAEVVKHWMHEWENPGCCPHRTIRNSTDYEYERSKSNQGQANHDHRWTRDATKSHAVKPRRVRSQIFKRDTQRMILSPRFTHFGIAVKGVCFRYKSKPRKPR